jgi:hypothetical protein
MRLPLRGNTDPLTRVSGDPEGGYRDYHVRFESDSGSVNSSGRIVSMVATGDRSRPRQRGAPADEGMDHGLGEL